MKVMLILQFGGTSPRHVNKPHPHSEVFDDRGIPEHRRPANSGLHSAVHRRETDATTENNDSEQSREIRIVFIHEKGAFTSRAREQ